MTLRQDHEVIKALSKYYGAKKATKIQNLPFFFINEEQIKQTTYEPSLINDDPHLSLTEDTDLINKLLPFHNFTYMTPTLVYYLIEHHKTSPTTWTVSTIMDDKIVTNLNSKEIKGAMLSVRFRIDKKQNILEDLKFITAPDNTNKKLEHIINSTTNTFLINCDNILTDLRHAIESIITVFHWSEIHHKFLIRKQSSTPYTPREIKTAKKKPWLRTNLHHYIYLNKLPSDHPTSSKPSGDGLSKRGHNRRAHWRYLKADCYKQAKDKRVRVKETWVGPTKTTYHNSTYTVLLEENKND